MDFTIAFENGQPAMTFAPATTIFNNLFLSLTVPRGSLFAAPEFGHRFAELKKNTLRAPALAEELAREATRWIIEAGRARSIEISAERDPVDRGRLWLRVVATQTDGRQVNFERFVEVV